MSNRLYLIFSILFAWHALYGVDAKIEVKKDVESRTRIAIVDASSKPAKAIFDLLRADLKISGHFLPAEGYLTGEYESKLIPPSLKAAEYLLRFRFARKDGATLAVRLQRSGDGAIVLEKRYRVNKGAKYPFLVHRAVSDINDVLGYESVAWLNRYVLFARYAAPGKSDIVLADYSFRYKKPLIRGGLNLFPVWADDAQNKIYYSAFGALVPTLYRFDIHTGAREVVARSQGMIVCSDVDTARGKILLTKAPNGQPDIYEADSNGASQRRLTRYGGIDVGGKYDGAGGIVFVSDRLGHPGIYRKGLNGSAVLPLVTHGKNNNGVDAHKGKIVYVRREGRGAFNIYLENLTNGRTLPLSAVGDNRFCRFSHDGNVVMFVKRKGRTMSVHYVNLQSKSYLSFPLRGDRIQSISW